MRFANQSSMRLPVEALSPDHEAPLDIFRHIGQLGKLWKASESYSHSDMLLMRRIIEKQLSARLHALKAYTEFPYNLPASTSGPSAPHRRSDIRARWLLFTTKIAPTTFNNFKRNVFDSAISRWDQYKRRG